MVLQHTEEEEESYFVSMTDMMVGVLFIFIILLMYFAFQLRDKKDQIQNIEKSANEVRTEILREVKAELEKAGVKVKIEEENGILRLPENVLFPSGKPDLSEQGRRSVAELAKALDKALKCHAISPTSNLTDCKDDDHKVETIFIEGHTDGDPIRGLEYGNWELSTDRATNTYRELINAIPELKNLLNEETQPIFSVSGYADTRPVMVAYDATIGQSLDARLVPPNTEREAREIRDRLHQVIGDPDAQHIERQKLDQYLDFAKAADRRIDIRIIMKRRGLEDIQNAIDGVLSK